MSASNSDDDAELWHAYARGVKRHSVTGVKIKHPAPHKKKSEKRPSSSHMPVWTPVSMETALTEKITTLQLDRKKERAMCDGSIEIDGKLDLHGMTQIQAYAALDRFMATQVKRAHRHLLIITGKGSLGQSVLRQNLPQWLETLPCAAEILSLRQATIRHGGAGAFYVILRRHRN